VTRWGTYTIADFLARATGHKSFKAEIQAISDPSFRSGAMARSVLFKLGFECQRPIPPGRYGRKEHPAMEMTQDSTLTRYLRMVYAFPKLSRDKELELWNRWRKDSDVRARDELVHSNLRYAADIARKYHRYGLPLTELIAEGNFGIVRALSKFDPERGTRFVTYAAYWIRAYVLTYVIRSWSLVGAGSGPLRTRLFFKLRRERARIHNLVGRGEQADALLAERFGMSREKMVEAIQRLESRDLSLDLGVLDGTGVSILDTLRAPECDQEQAYTAKQDRGRIKNVVRSALDVLDSRERVVVECHLMTDCEDEMSLAEIGRQLGVTRERARQLEVRAVRKLRQRIVELRSAQNPDGSFCDSAA
jgi:RNA polymerase sigma-32 factor